MTNTQKIYLIELGTKKCWISHSAKTMRGINNAISERKKWDGHRKFQIIQARSGVWAKMIARDPVCFVSEDYFGKTIESIEFNKEVTQ
jgi:hypothetical protein